MQKEEPTMYTNELTAKIRERKELNAEITTIEDVIQQELTTRKVEKLQVDVFKVRYKTVKSSRFDSKAFKAVYENLHQQYSKQTVTKGFSVV